MRAQRTSTIRPIAAAVLTAAVLFGCGTRREAGHAHHSLNDVIAALEDAGLDIGARMSHDEAWMADIGAMQRRETGAVEFDEFEVNGVGVSVYVFDLSSANARQSIERLAEARARNRPVRHDNLIVLAVEHPHRDAIRGAVEGL